MMWMRSARRSRERAPSRYEKKLYQGSIQSIWPHHWKEESAICNIYIAQSIAVYTVRRPAAKHVLGEMTRSNHFLRNRNVWATEGPLVCVESSCRGLGSTLTITCCGFQHAPVPVAWFLVACPLVTVSGPALWGLFISANSIVIRPLQSYQQICLQVRR